MMHCTTKEEVISYIGAILKQHFPLIPDEYLSGGWIEYNNIENSNKHNKCVWKKSDAYSHDDILSRSIGIVVCDVLNRRINSDAIISSLTLPEESDLSVQKGIKCDEYLEYFFGIILNKDSFIKAVTDNIFSSLNIPEKDFLTELSAAEYEKRSNEANVYFGKEINSKYCIMFDDRVPGFDVDDLKVRMIKKGMEFAGKSNIVISLQNNSSNSRYCIQGVMPLNEFEGFFVRFCRSACWQLVEKKEGKERVLIEYDRGKYRIPEYEKEEDIRDYKDAILKYCEDLSLDAKGIYSDIEKIYESAKNGHGGTYIFFMDNDIFASETERLTGFNRGIRIKSVKVSRMLETNLEMAGIDGAMLINKDMMCGAVGVIVDGLACEGGNIERGARYNSMVQYKDCLEKTYSDKAHFIILIISEDGMIDVMLGGKEINRTKRIKECKTSIELSGKTILVTGSPGFIGANLVIRLLSELSAGTIVSLDNMNDYYDPALKDYRLSLVEEAAKNNPVKHVFVKGSIGDKALVDELFATYHFDVVVNLAAQAGVRYSIDHPDVYIESNIIGFYNLLEACRHNPVEHLVYASSSSVYGGNKKVPFSTDDKVDNPVSLYAATKKSDELLAHAYSKLYNIPSTGLRFFTVYGPAGRPDMFYYSATQKLVAGETIRIFNYGDMRRDFTYIDDIVEGVYRVMQGAPEKKNGDDGLPVPPYAVYNIGGGQPENLLDYISTLQEELVRAGVLPDDYDFEGHRELVGMQPGDVPVTYADSRALEEDYGFKPAIDIRTGLRKFCEWYKEYYL